MSQLEEINLLAALRGLLWFQMWWLSLWPADQPASLTLHCHAVLSHRHMTLCSWTTTIRVNNIMNELAQVTVLCVIMWHTSHDLLCDMHSFWGWKIFYGSLNMSAYGQKNVGAWWSPADQSDTLFTLVHVWRRNISYSFCFTKAPKEGPHGDIYPTDTSKGLNVYLDGLSGLGLLNGLALGPTWSAQRNIHRLEMVIVGMGNTPNINPSGWTMWGPPWKQRMKLSGPQLDVSAGKWLSSFAFKDETIWTNPQQFSLNSSNDD